MIRSSDFCEWKRTSDKEQDKRGYKENFKFFWYYLNIWN